MNSKSDSEYSQLPFDHEIHEELRKKLLEETTADTQDHWKPIKLRHFNVKGYLWILYALIAGLCFGLAAFFIGTASYFGMKARLIMAWGEMSAIILYYVYYFT